uniref:Box C/D snoRNA protein 1 n=1 Tax=Otus sunia TaxID=257818 RepID=A0A8C8B366_9STRI
MSLQRYGQAQAAAPRPGAPSGLLQAPAAGWASGAPLLGLRGNPRPPTGERGCAGRASRAAAWACPGGSAGPAAGRAGPGLPPGWRPASPCPARQPPPCSLLLCGEERSPLRWRHRLGAGQFRVRRREGAALEWGLRAADWRTLLPGVAAGLRTCSGHCGEIKKKKGILVRSNSSFCFAVYETLFFCSYNASCCQYMEPLSRQEMVLLSLFFTPPLAASPWRGEQEKYFCSIYFSSKVLFTSFRCETCSKEEAKYRCPRCMKYSCSLLCVKKHKLALSCNGVRDKTAFVSVNEFTDLNLLSDYRFLEDVGRTADAAARHPTVHSPATKKLLYVLRNKARKCDIDLRTLWLWSAKFYSCVHDEPCLTYLIFIFAERVPDDKILADILKPYIDPVESDPVVCQRLKIYTVSPQSDVRILMKIENRRQNSVRYNELDASRSLLDNLKGKVIIEYPTLFVVLKTLKNDMVVLGQGKHIFISCYAILGYFS